MISDLVKEFYNVVISTVEASRCILPVSITSVLYDPLFTPTFISQHHMMDKCINSGFYYNLLSELYKICRVEMPSFNANPYSYMEYICDSQEIKEDETHGDYIYYYGWFNSAADLIAVLYMKPSHQRAYPMRAIFYGPEYQIKVDDCSKEIDVYNVNIDARNRFFIGNDRDRRTALMDFLRNTDREELMGGG